MHILRSNYSRNAIALIQWASEQRITDVTVVYIDTGWAAEGWLTQVAHYETWVQTLGFKTVQLKTNKPFAELMLMKQGFPTRRYQWCSLHLKGIPFLNWVEQYDPTSQATVLLSRRNADQNSENLATEFIDCCEFHGNRKVWQPLYNSDDEQLNQLLQHTGLTQPAHLSGECAPCINSSVPILQQLTTLEIERLTELEEDLETPLFNPDDCGAANTIAEVVKWAQTANPSTLQYRFGCSAAFGCGS